MHSVAISWSRPYEACPLSPAQGLCPADIAREGCGPAFGRVAHGRFRSTSLVVPHDWVSLLQMRVGPASENPVGSSLLLAQPVPFGAHYCRAVEVRLWAILDCKVPFSTHLSSHRSCCHRCCLSHRGAGRELSSHCRGWPRPPLTTYVQQQSPLKLCVCALRRAPLTLHQALLLWRCANSRLKMPPPTPPPPRLRGPRNVSSRGIFTVGVGFVACTATDLGHRQDVHPVSLFRRLLPIARGARVS